MDNQIIQAISLKHNINEMAIFNHIIGFTIPSYKFLDKVKNHLGLENYCGRCLKVLEEVDNLYLNRCADCRCKRLINNMRSYRKMVNNPKIDELDIALFVENCMYDVSKLPYKIIN